MPRALGCSRREIVTCAMRPVKGTSSAELNTCLVVTVDETWSLVSRDRDKGFLRGPRDVYILQNTHTHKPQNIHSVARTDGHPLSCCFLSSSL